MKRDTKRIEQLLACTKANRKLVREELKAGASLQHVHDALLDHEQIFSSRLTELKDWNKSEAAREAQQEESDRAAKLAEAKAKLLATPLAELKKIAAGTKAVIEIKDDTTVAQIVDAILATAPENI
jgi:hypothetical protein